MGLPDKRAGGVMASCKGSEGDKAGGDGGGCINCGSGSGSSEINIEEMRQ